MRTYEWIDKSDWGDGPWNAEPDKVQWIDEGTDLDCLAVRGPMGCWCGYVGLPPSHPWHGREYRDVEDEIEVHGGLTFSDRCMEGLPENQGVCHVPEPGRPADVWWLGFDCGHAFDLSPGLEARMRSLRVDAIAQAHQRLVEAGFGETYKPLAYVQAEIRELAHQLAEV